MVEPASAPDPETPRPSERYRELPERVHFKDMVATQETTPPPDPTMGRDTERDFVLRYAGG